MRGQRTGRRAHDGGTLRGLGCLQTSKEAAKTMYRSKRRKRMNHLLSIKRFTAISMTIMLALVIVLSTSGSAMAQEDRGSQGKNVATASSQQQGPTDRAEMEA